MYLIPFIVFCFLTSAIAQTPRRVIIDTDPGVDDAMADRFLQLFISRIKGK